MITSPVNLPVLTRAMLETYHAELQREIDEPGRLQAVYDSGFLGADLHVQMDAICRTAAQLLATPVAEVNLLTDSEMITIARYGSEGLTRPIAQSYCQHQLVPDNQPMRIEDAERSGLLCSIDATVHDGIRAYLGVPLIDTGGWVLGSLCVYDFTSRHWTPSNVRMLTMLAAQVMTLAK